MIALASPSRDDPRCSPLCGCVHLLVGALACVASRTTQTIEGRGTSEALAHRVDVVVALAHASVPPAEGAIAVLGGLVRTRARGGGDGGVTEVVGRRSGRSSSTSQFAIHGFRVELGFTQTTGGNFAWTQTAYPTPGTCSSLGTAAVRARTSRRRVWIRTTAWTTFTVDHGRPSEGTSGRPTTSPSNGTPKPPTQTSAFGSSGIERDM